MDYRWGAAGSPGDASQLLFEVFHRLLRVNLHGVEEAVGPFHLRWSHWQEARMVRGGASGGRAGQRRGVYAKKEERRRGGGQVSQRREIRAQAGVEQDGLEGVGGTYARVRTYGMSLYEFTSTLSFIGDFIVDRQSVSSLSISLFGPECFDCFRRLDQTFVVSQNKPSSFHCLLDLFGGNRRLQLLRSVGKEHSQCFGLLMISSLMILAGGGNYKAGEIKVQMQ